MEERNSKELPFEEDEIDLYELWQKLWNRRKFIGAVVLIVTAIAVMVSFLMTPVYRSEALLMPVSSQPTSGLAQLASQFLGTPLQESDTSSKVMAVLKSRTIRERVVKKLDLTDKLFERPPEDRDPLLASVDVLEDMVSVSQDRKIGSIKLAVEYKDPGLAREIASTYIEELQKILEEKALTIAKVNRVFLEKQVLSTERELRKALDELASFQKREKVIIPQEQAKGAFELYSELLSKKIALQVEIRKLEEIMPHSSPQLRYLREQLKAVEQQLRNIENSQSMSAIPSLAVAPEKISQYTRIFIKVKSLQAKYETILKLYEQAKIDEQKEKIYVEVIDPPSAPDLPVKPKKKLIVAVAFVSSLFFGIFLAIFLEWIGEARRRHQDSTQGS